jgi:hypothetical protein
LSADVDRGVGFGGPFGHELGGGDAVEDLAHRIHHVVDAARLERGDLALELIEDLATDGPEAADGVGDEAGVVERADLLGEPATPSAPRPEPVSGISLPIEKAMTLGWLMSLRTIASMSRSHHSAKSSE